VLFADFGSQQDSVSGQIVDSAMISAITSASKYISFVYAYHEANLVDTG
jgi:hypothetical protein